MGSMPAHPRLEGFVSCSIGKDPVHAAYKKCVRVSPVPRFEWLGAAAVEEDKENAEDGNGGSGEGAALQPQQPQHEEGQEGMDAE